MFENPDWRAGGREEGRGRGWRELIKHGERTSNTHTHTHTYTHRPDPAR